MRLCWAPFPIEAANLRAVIVRCFPWKECYHWAESMDVCVDHRLRTDVDDAEVTPRTKKVVAQFSKAFRPPYALEPLSSDVLSVYAWN